MAAELNKHHYKTKLGKNFTVNSFREIITNPKYKGVFVYNKSATATEYGKRPNRHAYKDESEQIKIVDGIDAIVSKELWDSVQPKRNVTVKKQKGKYLLSGLVKCPICGSIYEADKKNEVIYFRHKKQCKTAACTNSIRMDEVQKKVINKVVNIIYSKDNIDYFRNNFRHIAKGQTDKINKDIEKIKKRISANKDKKAKYINAMGIITNKEGLKALDSKIKEANQIIRDLTQELNQLNNKIPEKPSLEDIKASRKKLRHQLQKEKNMPTARNIIKQMIESVNIKNGKIEIILK